MNLKIKVIDTQLGEIRESYNTEGMANNRNF